MTAAASAHLLRATKVDTPQNHTITQFLQSCGVQMCVQCNSLSPFAEINAHGLHIHFCVKESIPTKIFVEGE